MKPVKFRVWQDNCMRVQATSGVYDTKAFLDGCYEDCVLMQFTGLKDKNEELIFEGDVLYSVFKKSTGDLYIYGAVYWDSEWSGWSVRDAKTEESFSLGRLSGVLIHGNIYENPELLK